MSVRPASADGVFSEEELTCAIRAYSSRLCLVLLGGVNYLTGQVLDMPAICEHVRASNAAAESRGEPPLILGVTVLTSMDDANLAEFLEVEGDDFAGADSPSDYFFVTDAVLAHYWNTDKAEFPLVAPCAEINVRGHVNLESAFISSTFEQNRLRHDQENTTSGSL